MHNMNSGRLLMLGAVTRPSCTDVKTLGQDGLVIAPNIRRWPEFILCTDFKTFKASKPLIQSQNHFVYTLDGILGY